MVVWGLPGASAKDSSRLHVGTDENRRHANAEPIKMKVSVAGYRTRYWCLGSSGRRHMIITTTVLIKRDHQQNLVAVRALPHSVVNLGQKFFGDTNVVRRMVIFRQVQTKPFLVEESRLQKRVSRNFFVGRRVSRSATQTFEDRKAVKAEWVVPKLHEL